LRSVPEETPNRTQASPTTASSTERLSPQPQTLVEARPKPRTHTVRGGDTFYSIGRQYGLDPRRIMAANPTLTPTSLRVGDVVYLPNR
jgi:LysM repeat protein